MKIDTRHLDAVEMLLNGESQRVTAKAVGVDSRTIRGWLKDEDFLKLLGEQAPAPADRGSAVTELVVLCSIRISELLEDRSHVHDSLTHLIGSLDRLVQIEAMDRNTVVAKGRASSKTVNRDAEMKPSEVMGGTDS
ncbi:hypothetical protein LCGC14_1723420 [marine sediment metagenome]|uniref:Homeodomain phBC6A51-type domain-containing protein n=1 Tax=marine sediment metagenome TaxID=412755 RepID=A0A0F9HBU7_9ZZZZ